MDLKQKPIYGFGHAAINVSNPVMGFVLILIWAVKVKSDLMIKPFKNPIKTALSFDRWCGM